MSVNIAELSPSELVGNPTDGFARWQFIRGLVTGRTVLQVGLAIRGESSPLAEEAVRLVTVDTGGRPAVTERVIALQQPVIIADSCRLPFSSCRFDAVVFPDLLHADTWQKSLPEARRVLSENGVLIGVVQATDSDETGDEGPWASSWGRALSSQFAHLRVFGDMPFYGRTIADFDPGTDQDLALDCSLVQEDEEPTHYLAVASDQPIDPLPYTVVQVPVVQVPEPLSDHKNITREEVLQESPSSEQGAGWRHYATAMERFGEETARVRVKLAELSALRHTDQWRLDELNAKVHQLSEAGKGRRSPAPEERPNDETARLRAEVTRLQMQLAQAQSALSELEQLRLEVAAAKRKGTVPKKSQNLTDK